MKKNIDNLGAEEVQHLRANLERKRAEIVARGGGAAKGQTVIIAQGDSWFDYPPGLDLLFCLKKYHGFWIESFANAGDTLENMVYGTKFSESNWRRNPSQMNAIEEMIAKQKPKVILFSAGGNDLAGEELDAYYNHVDSGLPEERSDHMDYMFNDVFYTAYSDFINRVCKAARMKPSDAHAPQVIAHTYAHAIPDGRGVVNMFRHHWIGPWLRPTFTRKGHERLTTMMTLVENLINRFEKMLMKVKTTHPNFHYVDFRKIIKNDDWVNELHLTNSAYKRCADLMAVEIRKY